MSKEKSINKNKDTEVSSEYLKNMPDWLKTSSKRIIDHMNADHQNTIASALSAQHGVKDRNAKMERLEVDGYFALSNEKLFFLSFDKACRSPKEYKLELVKNAKKYRAYELKE